MADTTTNQQVNGDHNIIVGNISGDVYVTIDGGPKTDIGLQVPVDNSTHAIPLRPALSDLLRAQSELTPIVGRDSELAAIESWISNPGLLSTFTVVGVGGSGKTRLALETLHRTARTDGGEVIAGFLKSKCPDTELQALASLPVRKVVVVDYAEAQPKVVESLLSYARVHAGNGSELCVLLLIREPDKAKWDSTTQSVLQEYNAGSIDLNTYPMPADARSELFQAAYTAFPGDDTEIVPTPELADPIFEQPLMVLIAALLTRKQEALPASPAEMFDQVLVHEAKYWAETTGDAISADQFGRAVAAWTLSPCATRHETLHVLNIVVTDLGDATTERLGEFADAGMKLYPTIDGSGIRPLQPDKLGERLIARHHDTLNIYAALQQPNAPASEILVTATRTATDYPVFAQNFRDEVGAVAFLQLVDKAVEQAAGVSSTALFGSDLIASPLARAIPLLGLTEEQLRTASDKMPERSDVVLNQLGVSITSSLVAIYRTLAEASPAAYQPGLAMSLNNLSNRLGGTGDRAGGLEAIKEAVAIYRTLAEANPAAYLPDLAMSLNNLCSGLGETGDRAGGLEAIKEAVAIYRTLAEANPAAYLPDLAASLNNLCSGLGETGDRAGGLEAIKEATAIYRTLAEASPAAYQPGLAMSLNNLSNRLGGTGDRAGGLEAIKEAVAIYRTLAEANPAAYLPNLAASLNNLSVDLGETGDRAGGLEAIKEAVAIRRTLAEANPAAYQPNLAMSLNNLAVDSGETGDRAGGLEAIKEAVTIRRTLAEANPAAYLPDLAMSLNNLAVDLGETGDRAGGLEAIKEAVTIRRTLAEANPAAYLPDLAKSLNNLSLRLGETGDRAGGLEAIKEAVAFYRTLAEANPAAYLPDLAASLNNLSVRLGETGDRAGGLEAIKEATAIHRRLSGGN